MSKVDFVVEPGSQNIVITQIFDAPMELVSKTYRDPNLLSKWWGPKDISTTIDKMEVKTGGSWRVVQEDPEGNEFGFHGVYHLVEPNIIIRTMEWEGMPRHVLLETVTFEELDGKTKATDTSTFQTVEDRDGMVETGMEIGAIDSYDRFVQLLEDVKK